MEIFELEEEIKSLKEYNDFLEEQYDYESYVEDYEESAFLDFLDCKYFKN
jgi:hypothetical protein